MDNPELYVIRHAHSPVALRVDDHQRPLSQDGIDVFIAHLTAINAAQWPIDHVLCSSALRTRQTLDALLSQIPIPAEVLHFSDAIYEAPTQALLDALHAFPEDCQCAALIGHNPGVSKVVSYITGQQGINFTPGTVAHIRIGGRWDSLDATSCELIKIYRPEGL